MRIAILGWGSLLWDGGPEFDARHQPWRNDGPSLPLEFARVSTRRAGALTLVIDEAHGAPTVVFWCLSMRASLDEALRDLARREETHERNIGRLITSASAIPHDTAKLHKSVAAWARRISVDGVVWTALSSNFTERTGLEFSVSSALQYLKSLSLQAKAAAREYIENAPACVRTPLRAAVEQDPSVLAGVEAHSVLAGG